MNIWAASVPRRPDRFSPHWFAGAGFLVWNNQNASPSVNQDFKSQIPVTRTVGNGYGHSATKSPGVRQLGRMRTVSLSCYSEVA